MQFEISFRPAQPSDWRKVSELLTSAYLPLEGAQENLLGFLLAFHGSELIGSACLEYYGCYGLLRSVAVAEGERGRGIGLQLVKQMLQQAKQNGMKSVVLLTQTAKDYFPRFGFRQISRVDAPAAVTVSMEFQGACPVSAMVMQLDL